MATNPNEPADLRALRALEGAIKTSDFRSVRRVASELGMDYNTYRRYIKGERELPFSVLIRTLQLLDLSWEDFARRVEAEKPRG